MVFPCRCDTKMRGSRACRRLFRRTWRRGVHSQGLRSPYAWPLTGGRGWRTPPGAARRTAPVARCSGLSGQLEVEQVEVVSDTCTFGKGLGGVVGQVRVQGPQVGAGASGAGPAGAAQRGRE